MGGGKLLHLLHLCNVVKVLNLIHQSCLKSREFFAFLPCAFLVLTNCGLLDGEFGMFV
jgi:hypothetical protein